MTLTTAPCTFPNSADAPTDCTCTSWMKSTPGSERAAPLQGQVVFVPSIRNWFSLVPEPNAEIVVTVPLDGDVAQRIEHAGAPRRDGAEVFRTETRPETRIARIDAGRIAVDDDALGQG